MDSLGIGKTYAKPQRPWSGFAPGGYRIDLRPIWGSQLQNIHSGTEHQLVTVEQVVQELGAAVTAVEEGIDLKLRVGDQDVILRGGSFVLSVLYAFFRLRIDGIEPTQALWFWFDEDHIDDDLHRSFTFFVVSGDKILNKVFSFNDYDSSEFNPDVFQLSMSEETETNSHWRNSASMAAANVAYWYRRFYKETAIGQLAVLRPDEPNWSITRKAARTSRTTCKPFAETCKGYSNSLYSWLSSRPSSRSCCCSASESAGAPQQETGYGNNSCSAFQRGWHPLKSRLRPHPQHKSPLRREGSRGRGDSQKIPQPTFASAV